MNISKIVKTVSLVAVFCGSAVIAAPVIGKVKTSGKTYNAYIEANAKDGKLSVQRRKDGPKQTFKLGQYEVVAVKMPEGEFSKMETAFKGKKYITAISEAERLFNQYKYLNNGAVPAQIWVDSLVASKKNTDAVKVCKGVKKFLKIADRKPIYLAEAKAYAALGKTKELASIFPTLVRFGGPAAAFVFNTQGVMAKEQGNNNDALLAYMKTFTMFSPEDEGVKPYRAEAKEAIIAIFKEMGDKRAKTFVNEK